MYKNEVEMVKMIGKRLVKVELYVIFNKSRKKETFFKKTLDNLNELW